LVSTEAEQVYQSHTARQRSKDQQAKLTARLQALRKLATPSPNQPPLASLLPES